MESSLLRLCPEPYGSELVEPPICCSPINYNSWFLNEGYFKGGFIASNLKLVRELEFPNQSRAGQQDSAKGGKIQFPHEQEKIMKKQAPIVFWDFEMDEEAKIDFKRDESKEVEYVHRSA